MKQSVKKAGSALLACVLSLSVLAGQMTPLVYGADGDVEADNNTALVVQETAEEMVEEAVEVTPEEDTAGIAPLAVEGDDATASSLYADTSWYDDDTDETAFTISTANELYGLAQLVNEGTETFAGKTVTLAGDIDLSEVTALEAMELLSTSAAEEAAEAEHGADEPSDSETADDTATDDAEADDTDTEEAVAEDTATDDAEAEGTATDDAEAEGTTTDDDEAEGTATDDAEEEDTATDDAEAEDIATDEAEAEDTATDDAEAEGTATDDAVTEDTATDDGDNTASAAGYADAVMLFAPLLRAPVLEEIVSDVVVGAVTEDAVRTADGETAPVWTPIGTTAANSFQGTFDGDGNTVTLYIVGATTSYQGLFGYVSGATIKNLTVAGEITVTSGNYVGGIAGYAAAATEIADCENQVEITAQASQYVGGVVGYMSNTASTGQGTITGTTNVGAVTGQYYVGGIAGYIAYALLDQCGNEAAITAEGSISGTSIHGYVGGLVGFMTTVETANCDAEIRDSSNTGDVTTPGSNAGGVCGYINIVTASGYNANAGSKRIVNTVNEGTVTGCSYVGGILGYGNSPKISGCTSVGAVCLDATPLTYEGVEYTSDTAGSHTGGLVGQLTATSSGTGGTAEVKWNVVLADVTGQNNTGGLIGSVYSGATKDIEIANNYVTGRVTEAEGGAGSTGLLFGLFPDMTVATVTSCFYYEQDAAQTVLPMLGDESALTTISNCFYYLSGAAEEEDANRKAAEDFPTEEMLYCLTCATTDEDETAWVLEDGALYPTFAARGDDYRQLYRVGVESYMPLSEGAAPEVIIATPEDGAYTVYTTAAGTYTYVYDGTVVPLDIGSIATPAFTPDGFVTQTDGAYTITVDGSDVSVAYYAYVRAEVNTDWYSNPDEAGVYHITAEQELRGLAELVNGGEAFADKTVVLDNDIILSDAFWTPIGIATTTRFNGKFDGNGYTVSNMRIYGVQELTYAGLFGCIGGEAEIRDLTVDGAVQSGGLRTAGVVGLNSGTVTGVVNCASVTLEASPTGNSNATTYYIGGVVAEGNSGSLSNVTNHGDITSHVSANATISSIYIAGIVGNNAGGASNGEIIGAVNTGAICALRETTAGNSLVTGAGIVGNQRAAVNDAHNSGDILLYGGGTSSSDGGGIVGASSGTIENVSNTGNITVNTTGTGASTVNVGGVLGNGSAAVTITNASNSGDVIGQTEPYATASRTIYAGGIVGTNGSKAITLSSVYNTGDIKAVDTGITAVTNIAAGGLAGYTSAAIRLESSYSTGAIYSSGYAGGLLGNVLGTGSLLTNAYSAAPSLVGDDGGANADTYTGEISGKNEMPTAASVYYMVRDTNYDAHASGATAVAEAELKTAAFVTEGNLGFAYLGQDGAFPVLSWTREVDGPSVTLNFQDSQFYALGLPSGIVTYEESDTVCRVSVEEAATLLLQPLAVPAHHTGNFVFAGWYTDADFETEHLVTADTEITAGDTFYARWALSELTITFDYNYIDESTGENLTIPVPLSMGESVAYPEATREGYMLVGWYRVTTNEEGEEELETLPFDFTTRLYADTCLRAIWQTNEADYAWYEQTEAGEIYVISTRAELFALANLVAGTDGKAPVSFAGETVMLTEDIDLTGFVWSVPIGVSAENSFAGSFYGGEHTISGLSISTGADYQGLFGYMTGGGVYDLTVDGAVTGGQYTGGVIGYLNSDTEPVMLSNVISRVAVSGGQYTGGVVGYLNSDAAAVTLNNVISYVEVTGGQYTGGVAGYARGDLLLDTVENQADVTGSGAYTGGIVGSITFTAEREEAVFSNVKNSGNVSGGGNYTGGLAGYCYAELGGQTLTFEDCVNTGDITGGGTHTGGIVGHACTVQAGDYNFIRCVNGSEADAGNAEASDGAETTQAGTGRILGAGSYAGGIVGLVAYGTSVTSNTNHPSLTMEECKNFGDVENTGTYTGGLLGQVLGYSNADSIVKHLISKSENHGDISSSASYVGGLVGGAMAWLTVTRSCNTGAVGSLASTANVGGVVGSSGTFFLAEECWNSGDITGGYAGGIAGVTGATLSGLTACYNTGSVRCEGTTNNYLGGLIGTMGAGSSSAHQVISDCYNTGDVTVESTASTTYASGLVGSAGSYTELTRCYNTGNITGMGRVAGIVFSLPATGTVRNCYNTGDLTVVEGLPSLPYIAGIAMVSGDGATVENCYSMGDITPNGVALTNVSGIVAGGTVAAPQSRLNTAIVTDCYYLTQDDMVFADAEKSGVTGLTLDAFTGGAAAFRLDMESATGNRRLVWSQSTETDGDGATWPVLADDVHTPVYQATLSGLTGPGSLTVGTISPISAAGETGYFRAGESLTVTATPEGAAVLQSLTAFNQRSGQLLYSTSKQTGMAVPTPTDAICVYAAFAEVPGGSVQVTLHSTEGYFTDAATEKTYTIPAGMTIQEYFDGLEEAVPEPVRDPVGEDEYFFRGWYSTETRSHPTDYFAVDAVLVEDTDLYAGWSIKGTVDVNYNLGLLNDKAAADGSVLSVPSTVSAKVGALAVPPTGADVWADWATYYNEETERFEFPIVLAEDGTVLLCYVLTGWTTSEVQSKRLTQSGDVFWNFETDIIPLETDTDTGITLYACWSMVSPQFEQGAGVPYEITEVNDFLWMAAISEQGYDFTGDSFTLGNDIDLSDTEWEASILYFNGALDGEEYTITLPGDLEMPLFNELGSAAVIEDLRLAGDITTSYVSREWSVLALYNEGALSNISADLTLNLTPLKYLGGSDVNAIDVTYVGGLVYANEQAGEIDDCTVALDFTWSWSSGNGSYVTTFYVGGIACQNAGTITACKTEGSGIDLVDCSCVTIKVGGIVNSNEKTGTISGCVNGMDILLPTSSTASGSYSGYIGGIAVSNAGAVTECTNLGKISSARSYIGGIVASMTGGTLTGCTNGDETDKTRGEVTGFYTVGGIIGKLSGNGSDITAEDLINYGTISNSIFSTGSVADVGGLIGQVQGTSGDEITLSSSENHGAVSHQYGSDAGGLVGDSSYLAISGCDNRGDIYFSPAYASRNDFSNKGGLVGYASYTTAEGCNNYGNIYAEEAGRWVAAGGLIGSATGGGASGETALSNCENYGNIAQTGETTSSSAPTGGLVGTLGAGVSMENCTSYGGITIEGASGTIGGLAGSNAGTITDCKIEESDEVSTEPLIGLTVESAVLRIDLNEETGQYYGGLVGNNTGVIDASSGEGGMVITGGTAEYVGGIAGINGNVSTAADSKITNSKYIGNISVKKGTYVGGVAGHNVGGVIGAEVAAGTSSAQTDVSYTGNITVETGTYIGGLLGANSSYTYQKDDVTELLQSKLSGAVFSGSVTAGGSGSGVGGSYVGGLIGANEGAAANIYGEDIQVAVGSIYMSDAADGTGYLGGLIGYNAVGASLKNSYATGGLSLPDGVDAETAAVGYLIGGNDVEERADVQYNYWYSTQSDDTAVSGIGVNVLADSASNYYGAEGWSESPGYSYSHGMWKSDDAFHSGEVAYYLDGANLAHQGVWTQDEAVGLPAYGDPSYYRVGVDSSSEGGSVTVVYGERSVTNTGALYVPSGGTVTVSVKLAAKTDTYEWNVSNIYMAGSGTEDEIIQTGSVRIPTDKSVTIWAEFYTTPLVKDPDPSPSPSTSAETVQSKSTGGSARSGSGSTINSNGVPGGSGTEPEGSTETGTGAPADQAGNGGDAATTTGTTPMTSQTSTATVDTPTVTVVAPVADVAQIAEGGTVPEAADAAPQSEEENPDEWTDPVEEEIEPEEPVDPEVYVLDRTAADVLAENPAIVALIVAVVAALIVLSVLLNYRRRKHSS